MVRKRDRAPAQSTRLNLAIRSEVSALGIWSAKVTEIIAAIVMGTCRRKALVYVGQGYYEIELAVEVTNQRQPTVSAR